MNKLGFRGMPRRIALSLLDLALIALSYFIAIVLRFNAQIPREVLYTFVVHMPWILAVYCVVFWALGVYGILWKYAGLRDMMCLAGGVVVSTGFTLIGNELVQGVLYRTVICIAGAFAVLFVGGVRYLWRFVKVTLLEGVRSRNAGIPLLVVGAGDSGSWAVNMCKQNASFGNPVAMVDDDPAKRNLRVQGVKVRGTLADIPEVVRRCHIREIVLAIPSLRGRRLQQLVDLCNSTHCKVRMMNEPQSLDGSNPAMAGFRELDTSDFLSRDEVKLDNAGISAYLKDRIVLVTGGGGSIGSELCRQIMRFHPARLLIFDVYENCAYELEMELKSRYGKSAPITTLIGSIRDKERLDEVFEQYHPSVVFHAAAHKHVPLMEVSPAEAVKNNVLGTKNLLSSASEHGVERFVQLSTDKAVNPTNVMGCTKRICEMLIQTYAQNMDMKCMAVRFGNVLGSHGSVIPLFESQIKKGGPVTITHPDIVRYFMTIPEAAQLVLQAGALAQTGSIYVLDMGDPVKIMDLAKNMIRFYGYEPDVNMEIKIIGLRPGEKLYEELLMDAEQDKMRKTAHNKIFVAPPMDIQLNHFYDAILQLKEQAENNDEEAVVELLQQVVPTYHPNRAMLNKTEQPCAQS